MQTQTVTPAATPSLNEVPQKDSLPSPWQFPLYFVSESGGMTVGLIDLLSQEGTNNSAGIMCNTRQQEDRRVLIVVQQEQGAGLVPVPSLFGRQPCDQLHLFDFDLDFHRVRQCVIDR